MIGKKNAQLENQNLLAELIRLLQTRVATPKILYTEDEVAYMVSMSPSSMQNRNDTDGKWHDPNFPEPRSLDGSREGRRAAKRWHCDDVRRWADNLPRVSELRQLNKRAKHLKSTQ